MTLSDAAVLAWWWSAWRRGDVPLDDAVDALDGFHQFTGLPGHAEPVGPVFAFAALRDLGATSAGLALPDDGDPLGLGGPAEFNKAALEAREAVVLDGATAGLVPHRAGHGVTWTLLPARRRQLADLGEADRGLRMALARTAHAFDGRNLGLEHPDLADALMDLRRRDPLDAPPGTPAACVDLAARGLQAFSLTTLAPLDELRPLAAAARTALVAACSPEVWPPDR